MKYELREGAGVQETQVRLATVVEGDERPAVDATDEPMVMTFPHLLVRELIALLALSLVLVLGALLFDAPLEELARSDKTPNPAKAPWYFLGLQELLHYYPPVISGVLLPGALIFALAIVPYFDVNIERAAFWETSRRRKLALVWAVVATLTLVFATTGAHPVWPVIGPLWATAGAATAGAATRGGSAAARWLRTRSLPFWIFVWFLLTALALTAVGIFFRGPGWSFTLPWRDGIYY
ncbi:MAG: hypothetical protein AABZ30_02345 [Myxococcota bacterium]